MAVFCPAPGFKGIFNSPESSAVGVIINSASTVSLQSIECNVARVGEHRFFSFEINKQNNEHSDKLLNCITGFKIVYIYDIYV